MQRRTLLTFTAATALTSVAGVQAFAAGKTIVVGGKDFTEQLLMATMTADLLKAHGFNVDVRDDMGSTVLRHAMENGQIDVYLGVHGNLADRLQQDQEAHVCAGVGTTR